MFHMEAANMSHLIKLEPWAGMHRRLCYQFTRLVFDGKPVCTTWFASVL